MDWLKKPLWKYFINDSFRAERPFYKNKVLPSSLKTIIEKNILILNNFNKINVNITKLSLNLVELS